MSDEAVDMLVTHAMQRPAHVKPLKHHQRSGLPWFIGVAVAAAFAAAIIPFAMSRQVAPKQVDYNGQSVSFISNSNYEVDSVINALNTYLANL